jgi:hypothetical protein
MGTNGSHEIPPTKFVQNVTHIIFMRKVACSILGQDIGYLEYGSFVVFLASFRRIMGKYLETGDHRSLPHRF